MFASHYYNDDIVDSTTHEIKSHRGWYIFEGLLFILIGMAAFSMPGITALTIEFLLATLFLVGGVIRFTNGILVERYRWWRLLSGSVYAIAGAAIFMWPIAGLTALLAVVGALLLMEGIFDIGIAMTMRPARNWGWMAVSGVMSLVLGILVFAGFPATGILYLAIALGLSFMLYGIAILAIAFKSDKPIKPV